MDIDYERDSLLSYFATETLKDRYFLPEETSPQHVFARAAKAYADDDAHAQRMYDYASKRWMMFSTPIASNAGSKRGLPISCYLNAPADSREGLMDHYRENAFLASMGGGIGGCWSDIRSDGIGTSTGSKSFGTIPFIKIVDSQVMAFAQGSTRRASYAYYIHISHPEIKEHISNRKSTGGDEHRKSTNLHHGIVIPDSFMRAAREDKEWNLIDPHTKKIVNTVRARELWELIIETRLSMGEPYIMFEDTVDRALDKWQRQLGLRIKASNLCSEIMLPTNENRTAVCCLSSVNIEMYDEWKDDHLFIEDIIRFLDNVISFFIKEAPEELWRAKYSATQERALGLGAMGFHSYLQKHMIPFEGPLAVGINRQVFSNIKTKATAATKKLAIEKGPAPESLDGSVRNLYLMAVAPNASTSIILNTSPSIEPLKANAFTQKTLSGSFLVKNSMLEEVLYEKNMNTEEVWQSIILNQGSVQHLDFLNEWEKEVFKTAIEIDQRWIVQHAADRQEHICQSQSVNLFFSPKVDISYINKVHFEAWEKGLKSLYYLRSEALRGAEKVSFKVTPKVETDECFSCQG